MKHIIYIVLLFAVVSVKAQTTDYNKIILPQSSTDVEFAEKLVQIAWNNHPDNDVIEKQVDVAVYDLKRSRRQWYDIVKFQGNLNEFNIDNSRDVDNRSQFYPRYNVAATVSLGMFFTIPVDNEQNKVKVSIAKDMVNSKKIEIRRVVMQTYNTYVMYRDIFNIQSAAFQDAEVAHQSVEESFSNGEIKYADYALSVSAYNNSKISKIQSQNDYLNAKLALESLIGMPLEDVQ